LVDFCQTTLYHRCYMTRESNVSFDLKHASHGRRAALAGGIIGLIPAIGLGSLRFFSIDSKFEVFGTFVFSLIYAAPYLLAICLSRVYESRIRGSLLLPLATISLVATFSSLAGVTLVLLPATVILLFAAVQSLRHENGVSKWVIVNGFLSMAFIALSFYALFGFMPDDPHIITNQEAAIGMGILIMGS
jgi:hypothetical protein